MQGNARTTARSALAGDFERVTLLRCWLVTAVWAAV